VRKIDPGLLEYGAVSEYAGTPAAATTFTLPGILFEGRLAVFFF
jgi:hypothetical protein